MLHHWDNFPPIPLSLNLATVIPRRSIIALTLMTRRVLFRTPIALQDLGAIQTIESLILIGHGMDYKGLKSFSIPILLHLIVSKIYLTVFT